MVDYPLLVSVVSFGTLLLAAWIGDSLRKRSKRVEEINRDDAGVVLGGTLTLLGLLIGFTFSMAVNRYDQRKNYEEQEANAIGSEGQPAKGATPLSVRVRPKAVVRESEYDGRPMSAPYLV